VNKNSLQKFAKLIGKTTAELTQYDMWEYVRWLGRGCKGKIFKRATGTEALRKMGLEKEEEV